MHVSAWWIVNKGLTQAVTVFLPPANMSQVGIWSSSVTVIISSRMPRNIFWWILPLRSLTENNCLTRWCCFVSMCSTVCFYHRKQIKLSAIRKRRGLWCQLCLVKQIWCSIITSYIFMHQKEVQPAEMINEDLEVLNKIFLHTGFSKMQLIGEFSRRHVSLWKLQDLLPLILQLEINQPFECLKTEFAKFHILSEENICIHNCLSENSALHNMLNIRRTKICLKSHVKKKNQKSKIIIQVCLMFFWKAALCGAVTVHHCALSNHQE